MFRFYIHTTDIATNIPSTIIRYSIYIYQFNYISIDNEELEPIKKTGFQIQKIYLIFKLENFIKTCITALIIIEYIYFKKREYWLPDAIVWYLLHVNNCTFTASINHCWWLHMQKLYLLFLYRNRFFFPLKLLNNNIVIDVSLY